jgi:parallel beta-helix repeat protein
MYACIAKWNENHGIVGGDVSVIENCSLYSNEGDGIGVGNESTIINCTSSENDGRGFDGGAECVFTNCTAYGNGTDGIRAYYSKIDNCTFNENDECGIVAAGSCLVTNNVCDDNTTGILANSTGNTIRGNNITNNATGLNGLIHNYAAQNTFYGNTTNWTGAFTPGSNTDMANVAIP